MNRMSETFGVTIRDSINNGFAYVLTSLSNHMPQHLTEFFDWVHSSAYPFIVNNSLFVALGTIGFTFLSSSMYLSNLVIDKRRELFSLASQSRVFQSESCMNYTLSKNIPKGYENIFVFTNKKLEAHELHETLPEVFELCGLNKPHRSQFALIDSLKKLNYYISFHDYSELEIKQALINQGWNFNLINQAFMVIDMELCNEIAGAHMNVSQYELAMAMKSVKELAYKGHTTKKIEKYLLGAGHKKSHIKNIFQSIHKVQKLHDGLKRSQERRIQRAIRLNKSHSVNSFDSEFNS